MDGIFNKTIFILITILRQFTLFIIPTVQFYNSEGKAAFRN